jgi:hypothetical protein
VFVLPLPPALYFPEHLLLGGNKSTTPTFYIVDVSGADAQLDSFEELAMPFSDQLYNFAHLAHTESRSSRRLGSGSLG